MQRSGTETIRTPIQSSKPKREISKITNSQNKKRTYGLPTEQLFPKRWPLSNPNRTKNNINKHEVKGHRNSVGYESQGPSRAAELKMPSSRCIQNSDLEYVFFLHLSGLISNKSSIE